MPTAKKSPKKKPKSASSQASQPTEESSSPPRAANRIRDLIAQGNTLDTKSWIWMIKIAKYRKKSQKYRKKSKI